MAFAFLKFIPAFLMLFASDKHEEKMRMNKVGYYLYCQYDRNFCGDFTLYSKTNSTEKEHYFDSDFCNQWPKYAKGNFFPYFYTDAMLEAETFQIEMHIWHNCTYSGRRRCMRFQPTTYSAKKNNFIPVLADLSDRGKRSCDADDDDF